MIPSKSFLLATAAFLSRLLPAQARCAAAVTKLNEGNATVNATGETSATFIGNTPWHFSLILEDSRAENLTFGSEESSQSLGVFLSVPESFIGSRQGNRTQVCTYRMNGKNVTSEAEDGSARESCNGILSDECQKAIRGIAPPKDGECPAASSNVRDACGGESFTVWTSTPQNFSSSDCSVDELPGVDLPDGYETFFLTGGGLLPGDASRDSFEAYDLHAQQPVPILVSVRLPDEKSASEVICLAPSNVTQGSHKPEGEFPPNSATGLEPRGAVLFAVAAAFVVGLF